MGASENFYLRWKDFQSNISSSFRELREDSEFFDVTLCCNNGTDIIQAHKVVLAACSPFFRKILNHQKTQQNPLLYMKGICLSDLQAILNFIYHGEVNVSTESLNNFLALAEELAIKGLSSDSKPITDTVLEKKSAPIIKKRKIEPPTHGTKLTPQPFKRSKLPDDANENKEKEKDTKIIKTEPILAYPGYEADRSIVAKPILAYPQYGVNDCKVVWTDSANDTHDSDVSNDGVENFRANEDAFEDFEEFDKYMDTENETKKSFKSIDEDSKEASYYQLITEEQEGDKFDPKCPENPVIFDKTDHVFTSDKKIGFPAFKCNLCDTFFKVKFSAKAHFIKNHLDETYDNRKILNVNFNCYECQMGFQWYGNLEEHFRQMHKKTPSGKKKKLNSKKVFLGDTKIPAITLLKRDTNPKRAYLETTKKAVPC